MIRRVRVSTPAETRRRWPRREVVRAAFDRDGWRCQARNLIPHVACQGPLDGDEILSRGRGGDPLDLANVITLCRAHHDWKHNHPEAAHDLGIFRHSWEAPDG